MAIKELFLLGENAGKIVDFLFRKLDRRVRKPCTTAHRSKKMTNKDIP
jgi:hypothetical protein